VKEWTDVKDDYPPIDHDVLTYSMMDGHVIGHWMGEDNGWFDDLENSYEPTHWMELPKDPPMADLPERARELVSSIRACHEEGRECEHPIDVCNLSNDEAAALILAFGQAERERTIEECRSEADIVITRGDQMADLNRRLDALKEAKNVDAS
jgi:hypothetical protein